MKTLMTLAVVFASTMLLGSASLEMTRPTIDPFIRAVGRPAFNAFLPVSDTTPEIQRRQYADGLLKIAELMASRPMYKLSEEQRQARIRNIERLREFARRERFSVNYDHPDRLLPCFIDSTGAICAVGYLIEQSAGREFAEAINRKYKYATIGEIYSTVLIEWASSSGLTEGELITIQRPALRPLPSESAPARTTLQQAVSLTTSVAPVPDIDIATIPVITGVAVDSASGGDEALVPLMLE